MSRAYWIAESKLRLILVFSYKLIGDVKVAEKVEPGLFVKQVRTNLAIKKKKQNSCRCDIQSFGKLCGYTADWVTYVKSGSCYKIRG